VSKPRFRVITLQMTVRYDARVTSADAVTDAVNQLLENAMSTPGVLDEVGDPTIGDLELVESLQDVELDNEPEGSNDGEEK